MPLLSARLALLTVLAGSVPAQSIYVVDAAAGPGHHFTDLPAAVAAAPSGSFLLVRKGSYTPFTVMGKSLHIRGVGSRDSLVVGKSPITVSNVPVGSTFVIEDLGVSTTLSNLMVSLRGGSYHFRRVMLDRTPLVLHPSSLSASVMVVQGAEFTAEGLMVSVGMQLFSSPSINRFPVGLWLSKVRACLVECTLRGVQAMHSSATGGEGLMLTGGSVADVLGGKITGGSGYVSGIKWENPGQGGVGARVSSGSLLLVSGTTVEGGRGGMIGHPFTTMVYGPGGIGVTVDAGCSFGVERSTIQGGASQQYPYPRAAAITGAGNVNHKTPRHNRPRLALIRLTANPDVYRLDLTCDQNLPALLLCSFRTAWIPLGPLGTLLVDPQPLGGGFFVLGGIQGPASFPLLPVPASLAYRHFWLQAICGVSPPQAVGSNRVLLSFWP